MCHEYSRREINTTISFCDKKVHVRLRGTLLIITSRIVIKFEFVYSQTSGLTETSGKIHVQVLHCHKNENMFCY